MPMIESKLTDLIWSGIARLSWKCDVFGREEHALFVGGLHVGSIMRWTGQDSPRYGQWRAWLMIDEDGEAVGWYETAQEARDACVDRAITELLK